MRQHVHAWHALRVGLGQVALCGLIGLLGSQRSLVAQDPPDPDDYDYILRAAESTVGPDDEVSLEVGIGARVADADGVQGWSCGVRHDPDVLTLTDATVDGTDVPDLLNPNGSFEQTALINEDGTTVGFIQAVILSLGAEPTVVPVTDFFSAARATYSVADDACEGGGTVRTSIEFTDELGVDPTRPIDTVVTVRGLSVIPSQITNAEIEVMCSDGGEIDLEVLFGEESASLPADQTTELGCAVWLRNRASAGTFETQAWQYGVAFDPELLEFVGGEPGDDSADLRGGNGPDFLSYSEEQSEDGSVTGVVVGVVIELGEPGTETLDVAGDEMKHVDTLTFRSAIAIPADGESQTTSLSFVNEVLGGDSTPGQERDPIEVLFVQNETGFTPDFEDATKEIELTPTDVEPRPRFIRSDANDDGRTDYTDGIWVINDLFYDGPDTACPAAADANSDGMVDLADALYIIRYQLQPDVSAGDLFPPPGAPFPDCGTDPDVGFELCPEGGSACN